jgi:hypothetical protein
MILAEVTQDHHDSKAMGCWSGRERWGSTSNTAGESGRQRAVWRSVSGKLTKRKHQGEGRFGLNWPNKILAVDRIGDQISLGGWGTWSDMEDNLILGIEEGSCQADFAGFLVKTRLYKEI